MLKFLFSNSNIERILLFLFVNEKGYGSQIQTLLKIPLTPIQNALSRLEQGQIIQSHLVGNKKVFELNPSYPLFEEIESLLKKAYTLLSPQEKKYYCFLHKPRVAIGEEIKREDRYRKELESFWKRLKKIKSLEFTTRSSELGIQEKKIGKAEVEVLIPEANTIIFNEKGYWYIDQLPDTAFSNSFRWTLDTDRTLITLEHLRHGILKPTFLFHLTLSGLKSLSSLDAHLCKQDTYLGTLSWSTKSIDFDWRIIGPQKNYFLNYHYK